jgi:hypothetical protein
MPQEIEVWYLIPALRREIAKNLIRDYDMNQKEVANLLGITEATISQYISAKRAGDIKFNRKESAEIKNASAEIVKDKKKTVSKIYLLCQKLKKSKTFCDFHKKHNKDIPKNCLICR